MSRRAGDRVYVCHLCGSQLARHDDGYTHWLTCSKANETQQTKEAYEYQSRCA